MVRSRVLEMDVGGQQLRKAGALIQLQPHPFKVLASPASHAGLEDNLTVNGVLIAKKDADAYGKLIQAKSAGSIAGKSELQLELTGVRAVTGNIQPVVTGDYQVAGSSRGKQSAERIGGGAALGAIIGAIAGGGKGAAIGAGVGAGAGTAVQVLTHGEQVRVPSETVLQFSLAQPFTITVPQSSQ